MDRRASDGLICSRRSHLAQRATDGFEVSKWLRGGPEDLDGPRRSRGPQMVLLSPYSLSGIAPECPEGPRWFRGILEGPECPNGKPGNIFSNILMYHIMIDSE
jgi:hypothetical protein